MFRRRGLFSPPDTYFLVRILPFWVLLRLPMTGHPPVFFLFFFCICRHFCKGRQLGVSPVRPPKSFLRFGFFFVACLSLGLGPQPPEIRGFALSAFFVLSSLQSRVFAVVFHFSILCVLPRTWAFPFIWFPSPIFFVLLSCISWLLFQADLSVVGADVR